MKERILAYREKHGLTQEQFCKLCGIGRDLLSRIERGEILEPKRRVQRGRILNILVADSTNKGE